MYLLHNDLTVDRLTRMCKFREFNRFIYVILFYFIRQSDVILYNFFSYCSTTIILNIKVLFKQIFKISQLIDSSINGRVPLPLGRFRGQLSKVSQSKVRVTSKAPYVRAYCRKYLGLWPRTLQIGTHICSSNLEHSNS